MYQSSSRDRRGRGMRGPLIRSALPANIPRSQRFAHLATHLFHKIRSRAPRELSRAELRIDYMPPTDTGQGAELGRVYPANRRGSQTIVLFYLPITRSVSSRTELITLTAEVLAEQAALLCSKSADDLYPF